MAMSNRGLTKLMEECGELIQIAAKKTAYINTDEHPDRVGPLSRRLADEIADVLAACGFVIIEFSLNPTNIERRAIKKLALFTQWHRENAKDPTNQ